MDKKTTTFRAIGLRMVLCTMLFCIWAIDVSAQCKFSCQDHVYLPLDSTCQTVVNITDVMNDTTGCAGAVVMVFDDYGNNLGNILEWQHRSKKLTYKVVAPNSNSCWGYLTVEDKLAPIIECRDDTVNCWQAAELLDPDLEDNCFGVGSFEQTKLKWVDYECEDETFLGYYERDVVTQDIWGNTSRCFGQRLYVLREHLDSLVCPEPNVEIECCTKVDDGSGNLIDVLWDTRFTYEDEDGYAHPIPGPDKLVDAPYVMDRGGRHYLDPKGNTLAKCNLITTYKDHVIPTCGSSYKIRREWKLFDWCTGEDTLCVQWIKIVDTLGPEIENTGIKQICLNDPSHLWYNIDAQFDCNSVMAYNITPNDGPCIAPRTFYVKPHDCVSHVTLERPKIINECGIKFAKGDPDKEAEELAKIKVTYQLQYFDATHPGKIITLTGDIDHGKVEDIYLPAGWFQVIYFIKDECWNESYACEHILVEDNVAPIPVCDEITQVTLDPDSCWTRIPAEALDDGSHDNCVQNLHYAIANMDSVQYYRDYWNNKLGDCLDPYFLEHNHDFINDLIEKWINCFVFKDYVDMSECGEEMVVLRVYEADGLPLYDPHVFKGTEHEWFCFNLYDDYACFYKYHYGEFTKHGNPRINLCDYKFSINTGSVCDKGGINSYHPIVQDPYCQCNDNIITFEPLETSNAINPNCFTCERGIRTVTLGGSISANYHNHGPQINRACCIYESSDATAQQAIDWQAKLVKYPELAHLDCKRYKFQHLYNDCMIQVIKDDKTPPVCIAPDNVTAHCDGVPHIGSIMLGNDMISWFNGVHFAHDICDSSDVFDASCLLDRGEAAQKLTAPDEFCVKTPWDGGDHGYYGGPSTDYYGVRCTENYGWYDESDWAKPIYCRIWLLLDEFDDSVNGKPDPNDYFGEPTIDENCWTYTDTSYIDGALDECGVGILTKTWIISDKCQNTSMCHQTVTITPRSDFEVKFPEDIEINCNEIDDFRLEPIKGSDLYPIITDEECELIGVSYNDQVLGDGDGCFKILRTWKVIDWCVYQPDIHYRYPDVIVDDRCVASDDRACIVRNLKDDGDGYITYLQVIKIVDDEAPIITCEPNTTLCSFDEDCGVVDVDFFIGQAVDNCTPDDQLSYRYTIIPDYATEERDYLFGHGNSIRQVLPVGVHRVILYAMDDCKNVDSCSLILTLKDCKPPTPYCYDGIATVVMPSSGSVEVWAKDLDAGSTDNCTAQEDLIISFDEDGEILARTFTCDDIPDGVSGEVEVEVYFQDEDGNSDFCVVTLLVQDGSGNICPDLGPSVVETNNVEKMLGQKVENGKRSNPLIAEYPSNFKSTSTEATLYQNRPNPYQNETLISFELGQAAKVQLRIVDVTGKLLLVKDGNFGTGYHELKISKHELNIQSGILYYQLETDNFIATKKMVIIE